MRNSKPCTSDAITVYYDGSCPLCLAEINHYEKLDTNAALELVDVSAPDFDGAAGLVRQQAMARFHVKLTNGETVSGARAFVEVWKKIPSWRWLAKVARVPGMIHLMEGVYRLFLRGRPEMVQIFVRIQRARKDRARRT